MYVIREDEYILYNNEPYKVLRVYPTGYCEIQNLNSTIIEHIHKKDLKSCPKIPNS